ncbi:hypothetical protein GCM10011415_39510 [Salipiger pallidus]|uniref:Uncharacterized protein n=1 Tax=Salipiger pallidus TaxID=1775170 RepID=A0A8J2ZNK8_9RHOB|nr:hypothetical protein GCM10011415_39510 [Salipiger pallidus]
MSPAADTIRMGFRKFTPGSLREQKGLSLAGLYQNGLHTAFRLPTRQYLAR